MAPSWSVTKFGHQVTVGAFPWDFSLPHKPPPMWADIRRWKEVAILGAILSASDILAFKGSFCEKKSLPFNPSPKSLKSSSAELDSRNPSNAPLCRWPT